MLEIVFRTKLHFPHMDHINVRKLDQRGREREKESDRENTVTQRVNQAKSTFFEFRNRLLWILLSTNRLQFTTEPSSKRKHVPNSLPNNWYENVRYLNSAQNHIH